MSTILDVLERKGVDVYCIEPGATVFQAVQCMVEQGVGSLLVTDQAQRDQRALMRGIITERDYLSKVVIRGKTSRRTPVAEIMSQLRCVVGPDDEVDACLAIMTDRRIRYLPVVAGERILGIVSMGDLTKHEVVEQRNEIDHIVAYMQGIPGPATFESICYGRGERIRGRTRLAGHAHPRSHNDPSAHNRHVERWNWR